MDKDIEITIKYKAKEEKKEEEPKVDTTVAPMPIPQTGQNIIIGIMASIFIVFGSFIYNKFKK